MKDADDFPLACAKEGVADVGHCDGLHFPTFHVVTNWFPIGRDSIVSRAPAARLTDPHDVSMRDALARPTATAYGDPVRPEHAIGDLEAVRGHIPICPARD